MAEPFDPAPAVTPVSVTPQEALEYFRAKGFAPPEARFSYTDWWGASHARGFVVAKAMQDDLLRDIRGALDRALAEGRTMEQLRAGIEPVLRARGWWGKRTLTDPLTGETREVQLGSARRLRVIFDTNMRTAYAAGRWVRIQRTKDVLPFLQYIQLQRVSAREEHEPFHELVVPVDHPWWATHFPPNGYFCACLTRQLSGAAVKRRGLTVTTDPPADTVPWTDSRNGRTVDVPAGIDPGFESNPGAVFLADQGRHDRIADDLTPQARGVELGLINEARSRGLRTGTEHLAAMEMVPDQSLTEGGVEGVAPVEWVSGAGDRINPDGALKAAIADPNRRIGVIHNHPDSRLCRRRTSPPSRRSLVSCAWWPSAMMARSTAPPIRDQDRVMLSKLSMRCPIHSSVKPPQIRDWIRRPCAGLPPMPPPARSTAPTTWIMPTPFRAAAGWPSTASARRRWTGLSIAWCNG